MYQRGEVVLYSAHGVCRITDIVRKTMAGETAEYYVLQPIYEEGSTLFLPTGNEKLTAKMRRTPPAEELLTLIRELPDQPSLWLEEESARRDTFRDIIARGDCSELMRMVRTLHLQRRRQQEKGKHLRLSDERFLKEAEKMLHDEFALVFHLDRDEVEPFILQQIPEEKRA